jgi:hypothetical protein
MHTNHRDHQIFLLRWWTHQGLEFIVVTQSSLPKLNSKILEESSTGTVSRETNGLSETTRTLLLEKLQQKYQGVQEWIRFGHAPVLFDPPIAEQALLFRNVRFQVEVEIFSLFKLKQQLIRN